ncbi:MAG: hypothetical protein WAL04_15005 [Acidimicrobiales bacterium]
MDDLVLQEWSEACSLMEAALVSADPQSYFIERSRWRRVEQTVLAVLGDAETSGFVDDESPYLRALAGRHQRTPAEHLERLAADPALIVRLSVAGNPATPSAALAALCQGSWHLRVELADNPSAPSWLVTFLAGDQLPRVRAVVATLPRLPAGLVAKMQADTDWQVRAALASNAAMSRYTLGHLTDDRDLRVSAAARRTMQRATFT